MKKVFKLCLLALTLFSFCMCENVEPDKIKIDDEQVYGLIYKSLASTPAQLEESILSKGWYMTNYYDWAYYKEFSNYSDHCGKVDQIWHNVIWDSKNQGLIIHQGTTRHQIQKLTNPLAYYKQLSDIIAGYGHTEWSGYYKDQNEGVECTIYDRDEFFSNFIDKTPSYQKATETGDFALLEKFVYTHSDNSKWSGWLNYDKQVGDPGEEGSTTPSLFMCIQFTLKRIQ